MGRAGNILVVLGLLILLSGCLTTGPKAVTPEAAGGLPPRYAMPEVGSREAVPRPGAIYAAGNALDLYSDRRAHRVGDILLVNIVETSSGTKKATTKTQHDSSLTGGLSALFGVEKWLSDNNSRFTPSATNLSAGLKNDFSGSGETKDNSTVTATLSARVTEVTLEGNLMIRGYREVRLNNENQFIIVSGLVRPEDVSKDNSVLSSHIADARIEYSGTGIVSDQQQPGWLARGLSLIWPF
ncbi:MAG: flagellar biosynthesis protein FlgH [Deltaproteobacteria bacterium CG_4_10_14_3_um_filter_60_8]|nr:MAG: flagellar biosynthesis protein FlgH [Desulfobacterales bacterium CG2_30_60_27]PIP43011.1 MAG: flagellar biosynthesis protein FlgH [Deltaproteobacteria bacterium CG23_combo_of_CG06-09_8_20_14_all_60_8]PIY22500.1 MAG: flagellar biosynthesis protein FlgH [Deltaproteobacteria bacterium CG_4_10_14_3_um_filter_60_8]